MSNYLSLFKNTKKDVTKNHPELNGIITIQEALPPGKYEVGLYPKEKKETGLKYYSGTIKPKFEKKEKPAEHWQEKSGPVNDDSEIPF